MKITSSTVWLGLVLCGPLAAAPKPLPNPDFTKGEPIPEGATKDWNLGATGARGWMYTNQLSTAEARQVYITKVAAGSPASGVLDIGDVILGVAGKPFSFDPRQEIGRALTAAEATDGKLDLTRWRAGKTDQITLELPVLGSYSPTAPYDCPKSKLILEQSCEALAKRMAATGIQEAERDFPLAQRARPAGQRGSEILSLIKKEAEWAAGYAEGGYQAWWYGYVTVFLSEYIMATGDKSVLPGLRRIAMEASTGQSRVGSWGHRFAAPDGRLYGYGMMNSPGEVLTIGLVLAREAGVDDPEVATAIERSAKLLRFYVGKGAVPYGDHPPFMQSHEDNGKCGMAAVLFDQLGEEKGAAFLRENECRFARQRARHGTYRQLFQHDLGDARSVALRAPRDGCLDGGVRQLVFRSRPRLGLELPPPRAAASPRRLVWQVGRDRHLPDRLCDATQGDPAHGQESRPPCPPWMKMRPGRWLETAAGSTATAHSPPMMISLPTC